MLIFYVALCDYVLCGSLYKYISIPVGTYKLLLLVYIHKGHHTCMIILIHDVFGSNAQFRLLYSIYIRVITLL